MPAPAAVLHRLTPTRQQVRIFFWVFTIVLVAGAVLSMFLDAAHAAGGDVGDPTTPTGVGDFVPLADLGGTGGKTLFESYTYEHYFIDTELTFPQDFLQVVMGGIVNILQGILIAVVYCAVALSWWLFSLTSIDGISDSISTMMGSASGTIMVSLFPTAVVAGAGAAYIQRRQGGPGAQFGQLAWLALSIVFAISLSSSASLWTSSVDKIRNGGADLIMTATSASVSSNETEPIPWKGATYTGTDTQNLLRKSGDATWRTLVVTPWCIAEFGSIAACKQYGKAVLDAGVDPEKRKDVIKDTVYVTEGNGNAGDGKSSATGQWTKGESWPARLGVVVIALIVGLVFAILLIVLAFASLGSLIMTWFLLYAGCFFALLWVIPGKPRQWGVLWFEALIGALLGGLAAMLVYGTLLVCMTALFSNLATLGWGPTAGLGVVMACMGFAFRGKIMSILQAGSAGGNALIGMMVMRGATRAARGAAGGAGRLLGRGIGAAGRSAARGARTVGGALGTGGKALASSGREHARAAGEIAGDAIRRVPAFRRAVPHATTSPTRSRSATSSTVGGVRRSNAPARSSGEFRRQTGQPRRRPTFTDGPTRPARTTRTARPTAAPRTVRPPVPRRDRPDTTPGAPRA